MQALDLIKYLYHPDAKTRYQCVLVAGMVEETTALGALQQRANEEPEEHIKKAIWWAGQRAQAAHKKGFSTINAIFDHFHINRELASGISPEEAEVMRKMQQQFDSEMRKMQQKSNDNRGKMALGSALGGAMVGGIGVGASQAMGYLGSTSMNMGDRPQADQPALRIPPTQVSDTDISQHIKRLMKDPDPDKQRKTALALGDINNPSALPYLALTVYQHPDESVKTAAETAGKRIYWNFNYIAMTEDGRLDQEISIRREEFQGGFRPATQSKPKPTQQTPQEDISAILDRAQKNKRKNRNS